MDKPEHISKTLVDDPPKLEEIVLEMYGENLRHKVYQTSDFGKVKPCSRCKTLKHISHFHKDSSSSTGLSFNCIPCAIDGSRKNHKIRMGNPEFVAKRREIYAKASAERKRRAVEYKGDKCFDCGNQFQDCVYDFHHLDGSTKTDNPSAILKKEWDTAKKELDLCVLLCSNCHRVRHFGKT